MLSLSSLEYLLGPLGISILLGLSACGSCTGMGLCGCSSILYADKGRIITYSYVSMIMISTIFFYAFILAILVINKLTDKYSLITAIWDLTACTIFGGVGYSAGISMGNIAKNSFSCIVQTDDFFISFMIAFASVEVTIILAFLASILIIYYY